MELFIFITTNDAVDHNQVHMLSYMIFGWPLLYTFTAGNNLNTSFIITTYPLSTPRTRLSMKNDPTTISGMKKIQLKKVPRASLV